MDEFFQNLNIWHVKIPLVNYATVEMYQKDRVLRRFEFRQPIPVAPEYDHIPTWEPIIVLQFVCAPDYMSWFRIHDKPYLLSEEQRHWQFRVEREQRGPLNPRNRDDGMGLSIAPTQSLSPTP
ncbi:hypothetical protein Gotur_027593 [Gossypium turneri]